MSDNHSKFTPISRKTGKRIKMEINESPHDIPRGRFTTFMVTEKSTGKKYKARTMGCGLPGCICDAMIYDDKEGGNNG